VATLTTAPRSGLDMIKPVVGSSHCSNWLEVTQSQIERFAAATGDRQWIHRADVEPGISPFKGPIAHGLLLASLTISLARDCGALPDATWVIYGFDKLRFRAPVGSGARIRCRTTILSVSELSDRILVGTRFVVEIEDQKIPALVTNCSFLGLSPIAELPSNVPGQCLAE
jgi:acyl dehydratase